MKKILLLTDFSKRNRAAEKTAINLCNQLQFDLVLMYNYFAMPTIPFSDGGPSSMAFSSLYSGAQEKLSAQAKRIREEICKMPADSYWPQVHSLITEGDIAIKICDVASGEDIKLVVMGMGEGSSFEHLLFGNIVRSVIKNVCCPVLVVPKKPFRKKIKKIVFATDFNDQDLNAFDYLARLSELLDFSIEVVHVHNTEEANNAEDQHEQAFIKHLEDYSYLNIRYIHLTGERIVEKIDQLCKSANGDWLAMTDHPKSIFLSLLHRSTIQEALKTHYLPILIFPQLMMPARYFFKYKTLSKGI